METPQENDEAIAVMADFLAIAVQHEPAPVMCAGINITVTAFAAQCVENGWTTKNEPGETEWALAKELQAVVNDFLAEMSRRAAERN